MKQIHLLLICTIFGSLTLSAQQLSLDSCKAMALRNNVKAQNALLEVKAAEQVKDQALTKYFPNIKLMGGAFHALNPLVEVGINDIPNANARALLNTLYAEYGAALGLPSSLQLLEHGYAFGVTAIQPVYMGGQIVNGNKLAQLGVDAANVQKNMAEQELILQTEESYWLVISLQEKLKTIAEAHALLDTLFHDVTIAQQAGLVTQNDVLKVTLKRDELLSNKLKAENGLVLAKMVLCQSIGIDYCDSLVLTDTLTADIDLPLDMYANCNDAVANRYETQLLDMNVEAEELKRKMTIGATLPQIGIGASYSYNQLLLDQHNMNGALFATVQVPLTGWWETGHKLKEQKYHQEIAENNRRDLTEKMALQTQQAWNALQESYQQTLLASHTVENAHENLTVAQRNYAAGLISLSELLEAQTTYRQALDQQNDSRIAYQIQLTKYKQLTR